MKRTLKMCHGCIRLIKAVHSGTRRMKYACDGDNSNFPFFRYKRDYQEDELPPNCSRTLEYVVLSQNDEKTP